MGLCILMGAKNYDHMLTANGYKPVGNSITDDKKLAYGFCFFILYGLSLLMMVCCTQIMKYTIKRERPVRRSDTTRISDLRGKTSPLKVFEIIACKRGRRADSYCAPSAS